MLKCQCQTSAADVWKGESDITKYAFSSASARQNLHIELTPIPVFDRERRTRIRSEANAAFLLGCRQMHLAHIGNGDGEEVLALAQVVLGAAQGVVDIHLV